MSQRTKELYEFGHFTLDVEESRLLRDGQPVSLKPKVLDTLLVLVENAGHAMDKDELMKRLWPDSFVEEANLAVNISQLRKALGEDGDVYIETVPKRGYRFVAPVTKVLADRVDMVVRERTRARVVIEEEETGGRPAIEPMNDATAVLIPATASGRLLRSKKLLLAVAASLVLIGGVTAALNLSRIRSAASLWLSRAKPQNGLQQTKLTKLTNLGRVSLASISPNGEYVAYVVKQGRNQSLWVHHIATSRNVEVIPPAERSYWTINFTPDGNYIEYNLGVEQILYRVALLGGPSTKVMDKVTSGVAHSPDGKRLAFVRLENDQSKLIVANADGTDQRVISTFSVQEGLSYLPNALAWSPDGNTIAALIVTISDAEASHRPVTINVADGTKRELTSKRWSYIRGLCWPKGGRGILIAASDEDLDSCQIWHVSYPDGELERVTNDLSSYAGLHSDSASNNIVTTRHAPMSTIWIAPDGDVSQATQLSSRTTDGMWGVCWTPDGRVVYTSKEGGQFDIWIMNGDGTGRKQLTANARTNMLPAVTPDGQWIVFSSNRTGTWGIWRISLNGESPTQLTTNASFLFKSCSADSRWVVYRDSLNEASSGILRVSIDGGQPVKLHPRDKWFPYSRTSASPDGKWIALTFRTLPSAIASPTKLGIMPAGGGDLVKTFDLPADITYECLPHWTADSKAICYTRHATGSQIGIQPLDGSPFRELADFKADNIWDFAWSPDGKQLAVARGGRFGDVVLINNLK